MARHIVTLSGLCVLLAGSVTANRGFQPALNAPTMHSLRSNASNPREKRWIAHEFGTGNNDDHLWDNAEVKYAINTEDDDVRDTYVRRIEGGLTLWKSCGLPDKFKWTKQDLIWCITSMFSCLYPLSLPSTSLLSADAFPRSY